ncbi:tripartite tricarboxylate transporter substrate-binding protein, partial [Xanthomonas citri pv. citri]
ARRLAESIQTQAGATVVVENKPGADGNLAALSVLKAEPDGYNVFVTTNSTHAANVNLFNAMPFDPKADFAPVAGVMSIPLLLTVRATFPHEASGNSSRCRKRVYSPCHSEAEVHRAGVLLNSFAMMPALRCSTCPIVGCRRH